MQRRRTPSFSISAFLSAVLHAGAWTALVRTADGPTRASQPAWLDPASRTLTGDTLVVDTFVLAPAAEPAAEPDPTPATEASAANPRAARAKSGRSAAARTGGAPSPAVTAPPALFGAVGVRFATDLATTFTHAFPQAASADPTWLTTPFGGAGHADVILVLDDEGHLAHSTIGGVPSAALRRTIDRTLALLSPRSFTARDAVTRLGVAARVSRNDVHDGLHGDVFALSTGTWSGEVATPFVALPSAGPGRRIDVEVRLLPAAR